MSDSASATRPAGSQPASNAPIYEWLVNLEEELTVMAKTVGLLGHKTLIGDAREFLVKEVLGRFLPPAVSVGRGVVIDSVGGRSRQCDIVIADSRLPCFRQVGGSALFPVESVIATIEVKSVLDGNGLRSALDNCFSVKRLHPTFADDEGVVTAADAKCSIVPHTYVFGFTGFTEFMRFGQAVHRWIHDNAASGARSDLLPAVIAAGKCIGFETHDIGRFQSTFLGKSLHLPSGNTLKMKNATWVAAPSDTRFGWLATHLLSVIVRRLHITNGPAKVRPILATYLPFTEYWSHNLGPDFLMIGSGEETKWVPGPAIPLTPGTTTQSKE